LSLGERQAAGPRDLEWRRRHDRTCSTAIRFVVRSQPESNQALVRAKQVREYLASALVWLLIVHSLRLGEGTARKLRHRQGQKCESEQHGAARKASRSTPWQPISANRTAVDLFRSSTQSRNRAPSVTLETGVPQIDKPSRNRTARMAMTSRSGRRGSCC